MRRFSNVYTYPENRSCFPEYVFPHVAFARVSLSPFPKANPYTVVPKSLRLPVRGTLEYCRYFPSRVLRRVASSRFSVGMSFTRDVPFDMYQYLFRLPHFLRELAERSFYIYNIFDSFHILKVICAIHQW